MDASQNPGTVKGRARGSLAAAGVVAAVVLSTWFAARVDGPLSLLKWVVLVAGLVAWTVVEREWPRARAATWFVAAFFVALGLSFLVGAWS